MDLYRQTVARQIDRYSISIDIDIYPIIGVAYISLPLSGLKRQLLELLSEAFERFWFEFHKGVRSIRLWIITVSLAEYHSSPYMLNTRSEERDTVFYPYVACLSRICGQRCVACLRARFARTLLSRLPYGVAQLLVQCIACACASVRALFLCFCEYTHLEHVRIHVMYRASQEEYAIRTPMAAPQEYVNTYSTRRVSNRVPNPVAELWCQTQSEEHSRRTMPRMG